VGEVGDTSEANPGRKVEGGPGTDGDRATTRTRERRALALLGAGVATGLAIAVWSLVSQGPARAHSLPAGAVALVNGEPIRLDDYRRLVDGLERDLREPVDEERKRHVLDRMIEEELLVQRAIDLGLARLDRTVRGNLTSAVIQSVVSAAEDRDPDDAELSRFYDEQKSFFALPPRLRVRQIFLRLPPRGDEAALRARADQARALLEGGERFEVVRAGFGDPEISPIPDMLLPPAKLREYVGPTAMEAALDLEVGETSAPVRSGVGIHILQVVEREPERIPELDEIRPQVAAEWRRRAGDEALRAYLDDLRASADVVTVQQLP